MNQIMLASPVVFLLAAFAMIALGAAVSKRMGKR